MPEDSLKAINSTTLNIVKLGVMYSLYFQGLLIVIITFLSSRPLKVLILMKVPRVKVLVPWTFLCFLVKLVVF